MVWGIIMKQYRLKKSDNVMMIIVTVIIITIMIIVSFLKFNYELHEISLNHAMEQVDELSEYVERMFDREYDHCIEVLTASEILIKNEESMLSNDLLDSLENICKTSDFSVMGITNLYEEGIDTSYGNYLLPKKYMDKYIINGEVYTSDALVDEDDSGENKYILIAVPLHISGEIRGAIWGAYSLSNIENIVDDSILSSRYFQIVDNKGYFILASKNKYAINSTGLLWDELKKFHFDNGVTVGEIRNTIEKGKSGSFFFNYNGSGRYVNYRPLGINNWYILSVQAQNAVYDSVDKIRDTSLTFFGIILCCFFILSGVLYKAIYGVYKVLNYKHSQLKSLHSMIQLILQKTKVNPFEINMCDRQIIIYGYPRNDSQVVYSFDDLDPESLFKLGYIREESINQYKKIYQSVLHNKECAPIILCIHFDNICAWIRVSLLINEQENTKQFVGVIENYDENKHYLDDIKTIESKAKIDYLTNIYNREAVLNEIENILHAQKDIKNIDAFFIIDIDHFKSVNDLLGHRMGDKVLQEVAAILLQNVRKGDIVGRIGGDEFVLFIRDVDKVETIERRAYKLNQELLRSYQKDEKEVKISASIGINIVQSNLESFQSMYEKADHALYEVKKNGRNNYCIYKN